MFYNKLWKTLQNLFAAEYKIKAQGVVQAFDIKQRRAQHPKQ